jgi:hypothetical protein
MLNAAETKMRFRCRPDVKRAVSARHLADKLGPNSVDDLIAFTSGEDWADSNIDELRSLLEVLRPNGWFLMHVCGSKPGRRLGSSKR